MTRRERLARMMGWTRESTATFPFSERMWMSPETGDVKWYATDDIPDPENSDADCMALVDWLVERGTMVEVKFKQKECFVRLYWKHLPGVWRDNYRHGVCELAEKIDG